MQNLITFSHDSGRNSGRLWLSEDTDMNSKNYIMKAKLLTLSALSLIFTGVAAAEHHDELKQGMADAKEEMTKEAGEMADKMVKMNVVETAMNNEEFTTLVAAVKAAGLAETLSGEGPFTIFAPTNAAFEKLPEGTVATLLKPENKEKLVEILTYHVVPGKVMAADVKTMMAPTVNGTEASVKVTDDGVMIDNAKVINTDIVATNGVIHVIDSVILPAKETAE